MIDLRIQNKILKRIVEDEKEHFENFYLRIVNGWEKPLEYCCICEPLFSEDGHLYGAKIKISLGHSKLLSIIHLYHELKHARMYVRYKGMNEEFFKNEKNNFLSEKKIDLYSYLKTVKFLLSLLF
jgi:hypothetical protein